MNLFSEIIKFSVCGHLHLIILVSVQHRVIMFYLLIMLPIYILTINYLFILIKRHIH